MTSPPHPCSILLLAGGRGQRMGNQDKGLMEWQGQPLIAHLHALARPLTDDLIISCNRNHDRYASYADHLVNDADAGFQGPLAGIIAGLAQACHEHMLVLPCDAPLLDTTLLQALHSAALAEPRHPVMVHQGEQWEPLFCIIPKALLEPLLAAWNSGERSPRRALLRLDAQAYPCTTDDPRLANLNTPELLASTMKPQFD